MAALDAVVGAVLLVAGLYLIEPSVLDLGLYLEAERYVLTGGVLIYAGLVLAYAGVFGLMPAGGVLHELVGAVFGTMGRFIVAAMMSSFAVRAALVGLPLVWVLAPAAVGLLALLSLRFAGLAKERAAGVMAPAAITADSGKSPPFEPGRFARFTLMLIVTTGITILLLGSAFAAYLILDRVFISGQRVNIGAAVDSVWRTLVPVAVVIAQALLLLFAALGAINWVSERRRERSKPDVERDLSTEETAFAADCVRRIREHVDAAGLSVLARRATTASIWLVLALGAIGVWALAEADRLVAALYAPKTEAWSLYLIEWPGAGIALLIVLLSLGFLPHALAKLSSRRVAEASGARMLRADRDGGALAEQIVKRVRDRSLAPGEAFNPGELMRVWGITTAVIVLVWNVIVAAGFMLWWPQDRARDTLYTEQGIETGDFWSMERAVYPYEAVQSAHVTCAYDGAQTGYAVVLPGGLRREVLMQRRLMARLDDAVMIDSKLRAAGVPFGFALPEQADSSDEGVVERWCVLALSHGMDDETRAKIERLFHLDEWFERRWRMRIGAQPRISSR